MKYIVLDTETTGVDKEDRIIQLAFLVVDEDGKMECYESFAKPKQKINFNAMSVHHITPEMIENSPELVETEAYKKLEELNSPENYIIIQNATFDLPMLAKEGFKSKMKLIDSLILARHLLPNSERHAEQFLRYSLGLYKDEMKIAEKLGRKEIAAHDAVGDVIVLWLLFLYLKNIEDYDLRVKRIANAEKELDKAMISVHDLLKFSKNDQLYILSQIPQLLRTIKFGKYRNEEIVEIIAKDPGYIQWMLDNVDDMEESLEYTLRFHLYDDFYSDSKITLPEMKNKNQENEKVINLEKKQNVDTDENDEQLSFFDL